MLEWVLNTPQDTGIWMAQHKKYPLNAVEKLLLGFLFS